MEVRRRGKGGGMEAVMRAASRTCSASFAMYTFSSAAMFSGWVLFV